MTARNDHAVVMYHYVEDTVPRFPYRHHVTPGLFRRHLDHLAARFDIVPLSAVEEAAVRGYGGSRPLCALTFDDGLRCHVTHVLPELRRRGIPATFFVSRATVDSERVLPVHKVQAVLAATADHGALVETVENASRRAYGAEHDAVWATLVSRFRRPSGWDGAEVALLKGVLREGPEPLRKAALDELFDVLVGIPERELARELYLDSTDLDVLAAAGMEIGGHGDTHVTLDGAAHDVVVREVSASAWLVNDYQRGDSGWRFAYPFGAYDATTVTVLAGLGCRAAVTTDSGLCGHGSPPLELPRLDCNEVTAALRSAEAAS